MAKKIFSPNLNGISNIFSFQYCLYVCLFVFLKKDAEVLSKIPKGWIPCFFIRQL